MDDTIEHELLTLINDELSIDPETPVERDTDLIMTGQIDSIGVMEIVDWLEVRLEVDIDSIDIVRENFQTVVSMIRFTRTLVDPP